jgi:hypothetical protein
MRNQARATLAGYLESVAYGCLEASESRDRRVWETMRGVLRLARQTIQQLQRGAAGT